MIKYFVTSDIHSFYKEFLIALHQKGFDLTNHSHKVIICGDLFDRGDQSVELFDFIKQLQKEERLVYIRGNHEDLLFDCANQMRIGLYPNSHHFSNGTVNTVSQLTGVHPSVCTCGDLYKTVNFSLLNEVLEFIDTHSVDYFELPHAIFVHGWIPCITQDFPAWYKQGRKYMFDENWRDASNSSWNTARWFNGMELSNNGIYIPDKLIVCGHWHTSWGHAKLNNTSEFGDDARFTPFITKTCCAIDSCVAHSYFLNCVVFDENGKLINQ